MTLIHLMTPRQWDALWRGGDPDYSELLFEDRIDARIEAAVRRMNRSIGQHTRYARRLVKLRVDEINDELMRRL